MYTEEQIIRIRQELEWAIHNLNTIIFKRTDVSPWEDSDDIDLERATQEIEKIEEIIYNEKT